jgi:hypothetical protein
VRDGVRAVPNCLLREKIEKRRREEKDARIHKRLSVLLWLNRGEGGARYVLDVWVRHRVSSAPPKESMQAVGVVS